MSGASEKSKAAYNKKAAHYEHTADGRFTRRFKQLIADSVQLQAGMSVLDVGCGNGRLLAALRKRAAINGFGVDLAERMVGQASRLNPEMTFFVAGCENIPLAECSMDLIVVSAAYHHFPDVAAFAKEAGRLLKPGGAIYIADIYLPVIFRRLLNPLLPYSPDGDVRFYSPKEISANFEPLDFQLAGAEIYGHIQVITLRKPA
ncbi:MAG: methyltransferase domain-containing protein [Oscillospiraceae bacterium]|nr:methyltransferase domain-containing protein [Oscillospiraceae bacterium]